MNGGRIRVRMFLGPYSDSNYRVALAFDKKDLGYLYVLLSTECEFVTVSLCGGPTFTSERLCALFIPNHDPVYYCWLASKSNFSVSAYYILSLYYFQLNISLKLHCVPTF